MPKRFELKTKTFFLTYSQCDLTCEVILSELKTKISRSGDDIVEYIVAREVHQVCRVFYMFHPTTLVRLIDFFGYNINCALYTGWEPPRTRSV